jgi:hypothetical protein
MARILFKAGKGRDGYFTTDNIIAHAKQAMDILEKHFPDDDHILIFDNTSTHLKRADDAPAARDMPKNPSQTWGTIVTIKDACGNIMRGPDGKTLKRRSLWLTRNSQMVLLSHFIFPRVTARQGGSRVWQKSSESVVSQMRQDLERSVQASNAPLTRFHKVPRCCCRRFLYNQPDFFNVKSHLETVCEEQGFRVLFLPKFHCELNFIEMCWGFAKRIYRQFPLSSREDDLERNVIAALDSIPLASMRR